MCIYAPFPPISSPSNIFFSLTSHLQPCSLLTSWKDWIPEIQMGTQNNFIEYALQWRITGAPELQSFGFRDLGHFI